MHSISQQLPAYTKWIKQKCACTIPSMISPNFYCKWGPETGLPLGVAFNKTYRVYILDLEA